MILINKINYKENKKIKEFNEKTLFSASSIPIAQKCMGSLLIKSEDTIYSDTGKKIHLLVAGILQSFYNNPNYDSSDRFLDIKNVLKNNLKIDKEQTQKIEDLCKDYINEITALMQNNSTQFIAIEEKFHGLFFNNYVTAIPDCIIYENDNIHIYDLKTGFKKITSNTKWSQLMIPGILMIDNFLKEMMKEGKFFIKDIKIHMNIHSIYGKEQKSISIEDLYEFKNFIIQKMNSEIEFNTGNHCLECYKFNKCPVIIDKSISAIETLNKKNIPVAELLDLKSLINKFYKRLEKEILERWEENKKLPPNIYIGESRKSRVWKNPEELKNIRELWKKTLMSPVEGENLNKELNFHENFQSLWKWIPGKKVPKVKNQRKEKENERKNLSNNS